MKLRAGAGDFREGDRLVPEQPLAEHVHAVVGAPGVEHVGHEQRVVERRQRDAAAGEDVPIVFGVVRDLEHAGIFQQRLQAGEHGVGVELARHRLDFGGFVLGAEEVAGAFHLLQPDVAERDVDRLVPSGAERDPDEIGGERVDAGGFRVDREVSAVLSGGNHGVERREHVDRNVARAVERQGAQGGGTRGRERAGAARLRRFRRLLAVAGVLRRDVQRLGVAGEPLAPAVAPARGADEGRVRLDLAGFDGEAFGGAFGQRGELERLEIADQRPAVGRCEAERVERGQQVDVALQRNEVARQADQRHALGIGQRFALLRLLDLAGAGEQRLEVAVFGDQLGRRLHADAAGAGHVVGGITGQRLDVDHQLRADAEIGEHFFRADLAFFARADRAGDARRGIVHRHSRADQLHQILVGGNDEDVRPAPARLFGIGRDEVVGLVGVLLDGGEAERAHAVAHQRELRHEVVGRLGAVRLVGGVDVAPERVLRLVEDDGEVGRHNAGRAFPDELEQLGAEQADRARRQPVGAVVVFGVLPDRLENKRGTQRTSRPPGTRGRRGRPDAGRIGGRLRLVRRTRSWPQFSGKAAASHAG